MKPRVHRKGVVKIEIQRQINRLESLLNDGWNIPLTRNLIINRDKYWEIIDQMRVSIPEELKRARRLEQERDRIVAQAQEEADRIIALAKEQAANLANEHEVMQSAQARADTVVERAHHEAEEIRRGADEYAVEVLTELQSYFTSLLTTVQNGIAAVQQRYADTEDKEPQEASKPS